MEPKTRAEHLQWCKNRALGYVDDGDLTNALASMMSDLRKHPETSNHVGISLGMIEMAASILSDADEMRKFIEGFN